jgi:hypothetical protein
MPVSLISWKSIQKNSLRGFAKVRVGKALVINDVSVHCSHGKRWASLPSKPLINADGTAKTGENGKVVYVPVMEWADRETAYSFSSGVIEAVEREHPGVTQADAA